MRIRVSAPASIRFSAAETSPDIIDKFLNEAISEKSCLDYLDVQFLSSGLSDGKIRTVRRSDDSSFYVATTYDCSENLSDAMVAKLVRATKGQWSDGLGAGCFQELANTYGATIDLAPIGVSEEPSVEVSQTPVKPATAIAKGKLFKAAADGDVLKT